MKKMLAIVLMLCIALFATAASAEVYSYLMIGAQDANGNQVNIENNPEFPILVFAFDNESNECAFGNQEEQGPCTYEITDETDTQMTFNITDEAGNTMQMIYLIEEDSFAFQSNGMTFVLAAVEE